MTDEQQPMTPPDAAEDNERILQEARERAAGASALMSDEQAETPEVFEIGGALYYMPPILKWNFQQDEAVLDLAPDLMPLIDRALTAYRAAKAEEAEGETRTLGDLAGKLEEGSSLILDAVRLIGEKRLHRRLLAAMLLPITTREDGTQQVEPFDADRLPLMEERMGWATNGHLLVCLTRFFTIASGGGRGSSRTSGTPT